MSTPFEPYYGTRASQTKEVVRHHALLQCMGRQAQLDHHRFGQRMLGGIFLSSSGDGQLTMQTKGTLMPVALFFNNLEATPSKIQSAEALCEILLAIIT